MLALSGMGVLTKGQYFKQQTQRQVMRANLKYEQKSRLGVYRVVKCIKIYHGQKEILFW